METVIYILGVLGRLIGLVGMLLVAFMVLGVSFVTGQGAEIVNGKLVAMLADGEYPWINSVIAWLPSWLDWVLPHLAMLVFTLPSILTLLLWKHAMAHVDNSLKNAKTQSLDFVLARGKQRAGRTLWALLQAASALLLPVLPIGASTLGNDYLPKFMQAEPRTVTVVKYSPKLVPVTDRIYFQKGRLLPDDRFVEEGSNLPRVAGATLRRTASSLGLGPKCSASVSLHGFSSDEEFSHLDCHRNHRKNLELADHRAQDVFKKLSDLPEVKRNWLTVRKPMRWTPAINTLEDVEESWKEMCEKRKELVRQLGTGCKDPCPEQREQEEPKRNPEMDRVVVLEWTLDKACEASAETL